MEACGGCLWKVPSTAYLVRAPSLGFPILRVANERTLTSQTRYPVEGAYGRYTCSSLSLDGTLNRGPSPGFLILRAPKERTRIRVPWGGSEGCRGCGQPDEDARGCGSALD